MKSYSSLTYKYLKVQLRRTILTVLGIILSVALITSIFTMLISLREKLIQDAIKETGDYYAVIKNTSFDTAEKITGHVNAIKSGITTFEGYSVIGTLSSRERETLPGIPPYRYLSITAFDRNAFGIFRLNLKEGRLPQAPGEIVIDYPALELMPGKPKIGDTVNLELGSRLSSDGKKRFQDNEMAGDEIFQKTGQKAYTIVGLLQNSVLYSGRPIYTALTYLDTGNMSGVSGYNAYIRTPSPQSAYKDTGKILKDLSLAKGKVFGDKNVVEYNEKVLRLSAQSLDPILNQTMKFILTFIVLLIIISTVAVIYNAFHISVLERISQFGVLRCTGASPAQIRKLVFREAALLSLIGIPLGLVSGIFAMKVVMYFIGTMSFSMINFFDNLNVVISAPVLILSSLLGLLTVFLSAWLPARQASKVSPLEAVRNAGAYSKENFSKVKRRLLFGRLFNIEGQIAFKNLRRNRKRFRITVFSMTISIVLYIVFGTFINMLFGIGLVYSEAGFDFGLSKSGANSKYGMSLEQYKEIKGLPGVEAVYKDMRTRITALVPDNKLNARFAELKSDSLKKKQEGMTVLDNCTIMSPGSEGLDILKKNLIAGKVDASRMNSQGGVILLSKNQFYSSKIKKTAILEAVNYKVGDEIKIAVNTGKDPNSKKEYKVVKVAGILNEGILGSVYIMDGGIQLFTTEEVYKSITGNDSFTGVAVKLKSGADRVPVANYLKGLREKDSSFEYEDIMELNNELKTSATAMSIFLYGFVAVIALIGCLNIINTISTNLLLRTRELSVLKAVGMTENGIKRMVGLEGLLYGTMAAIFGGVVGIALSYLLYSLIIGVREVGWQTPWTQLITGVAGTLIITLAASYLPLRRINKGNIIDNIRMEN